MVFFPYILQHNYPRKMQLYERKKQLLATQFPVITINTTERKT